MSREGEQRGYGRQEAVRSQKDKDKIGLWHAEWAKASSSEWKLRMIQ